MNRLPVTLGDHRRRAVLETVQSILDVKGSDVWTIAPDATVYEGIALMSRHRVGALVVTSGTGLDGIISERDYARKVILRGLSSKQTLVSAIMTAHPIVVTPAYTIDECLHIMIASRIRHLPVMREAELAGIVSVGDLVKAIITAQVYTIDQLEAYINTA